MGGCISSSSNGENVSPHSCFEMSFFRRKVSRRAYSYSNTSLQHLSSIPNRIFSNGRSSGSCIFTQQGRKGINQDAMIVWEDFIAEDDVTFCGVFDGHGPYGHLVARRVRDALPLKLLSFVQSCKSKHNGSVIICCNEDPKSDVVDPEKKVSVEDQEKALWREAFLKSYKAMDKELRSYPNLDCFCSGSTAVSIVKQGSNLFMGNIGDSRAILASKDESDSLVANQLTVDLKPDLPKEAERIKRCKGRVFALPDEPEVPRVWLPFDDAPGLAMARAFGDFCLKDYGVISVPEFTHRVLSERDKFIVLASDGVWDVLSNKEVVEIVSSAPTRSSAARIVVESAACEWKSKYPTSKMDDCAVVCMFLDGKMDSDSSDYEQQQEQQGGGGFSSASATRIILQSRRRHHSAGGNESDDDDDDDDDGQNITESACSLQRNFTVRSSQGNVAAADAEDLDWSGLEGVTRVNSLVQLPRFSQEFPKP